MQQAHHRRTRGTWVAEQLDYWVPLIIQDVTAEEGSEKSAHSIYNPYFDANQLLITVIAYLGVLLTFGLVFPPIAVAMLVSIYAAVYTGKLEVGRFLTNAIDQNLLKYLDVMESECLGVGTVVKLRQAALMLITFTCVFFTPFIFDTLGDKLGVAKAAWVLVVLPLVPAALYLYALARDAYMHRMQAGLSVGKESKGVLAEDAGSGAVCDEDEGGEDGAYTLNALQSQQHQL
jgi:prepilin signal peptidase PulO-like enzyme (type II secretory pathway)